MAAAQSANLLFVLLCCRTPRATLDLSQNLERPPTKLLPSQPLPEACTTSALIFRTQRPTAVVARASPLCLRPALWSHDCAFYCFHIVTTATITNVQDAAVRREGRHPCAATSAAAPPQSGAATVQRLPVACSCRVPLALLQRVCPLLALWQSLPLLRAVLMAAAQLRRPQAHHRLAAGVHCVAQSWCWHHCPRWAAFPLLCSLPGCWRWAAVLPAVQRLPACP